MYIELAGGANVMRLVVTGAPARETVLEQWETIVQENAKANGDYGYGSYFQLLKSYIALIAQYTIVKSILMRACYQIHYKDIEELRRRGFKINVSDSETYKTSLAAAMRKVGNLITKSLMKKGEIERQFKDSDRKTATAFPEVIAGLNVSLGFSVDKDITLSEFNEYKKILKAKNTAARAMK